MAKAKFKNNSMFIDSLLSNDLTYIDYLERLKKIAMSIFEWVNLPKSMDSIWLEKTLYYNGMATLLKDKNYGFINTACVSSGYTNIYGLPTSFECYSFDYTSRRKLYTGLSFNSENKREYMEDKECILVMNNFDRIPTAQSIELFAFRLFNAERTCDININAQRTPILIITDEKQRLSMENLYSQYEGNKPVIFGDKNQLGTDVIRSINTQANYITDRIMDYKKEIWNEALTFLGINNMNFDKKERLLQEEINSNNELINLNLQSYFVPRKKACEQFNEKFNLKGTDKEIDVRIRSDLHNIIKQNESIITSYIDKGDDTYG